MRKSRQETAETRRRIVEAASTEFRRNGIDRTGLADLMMAAGLTHGGFYKHFESKEQVVEESIRLAVDSMIDAWTRTFSSASPNRGLRTAIAEYLSVHHRDDAATSCPFSALGSEMARSGEVVRESATKGFLKMIDLIAGELDGLTPAAARKEALWIMSTMIGAVTMARVVTDPELSASILRETLKHLTRPS
jgi:TetR/AcrR family transcriptional regulator, transcriptional repressor for nem operon